MSRNSSDWLEEHGEQLVPACSASKPNKATKASNWVISRSYHAKETLSTFKPSLNNFAKQCSIDIGGVLMKATRCGCAFHLGTRCGACRRSEIADRTSKLCAENSPRASPPHSTNPPNYTFPSHLIRQNGFQAWVCSTPSRSSRIPLPLFWRRIQVSNRECHC